MQVGFYLARSGRRSRSVPRPLPLAKGSRRSHPLARLHEAIAVWEEENGVPGDPDSEYHNKAPLTAAPVSRRRAHCPGSPRRRLCRKMRHHYAESTDGLLRLCLGCAGGVPPGNRHPRQYEPCVHVDLDDLVALARSKITRGLTAEECQKFLHQDHCPN
jgi:hypothetical protein